MQDAAGHSAKSENLVKSPGKVDRIERDAGHSASSSGIEAQGAVAVPDFTPLRNGSGCVNISPVFWITIVSDLLIPPAIYCDKRLRQGYLPSGPGLGRRRQKSIL